MEVNDLSFIRMPENVKMLMNRIKSFGHEAVIVGGCVRDSFMGSRPHDWDIATSAQPTEIMDIFKHYRLMTAGLKHGTVTVIIDHEPYEITTYRIDGKYSDFRRPDSVSFTNDLAEDIMRRDFTINAIAYDGEKIIDYHDGVGDLERGIIRCVGNAEDRFQEDPLRILRAIRFAARFDFEIEESTSKAMRKYMHLLTNIAIERKQSEFTKAICSNSIASGLYIMSDYQDVLNYAMPGIEKVANWKEIIGYIDQTKDLYIKLAFILDSLNVIEYNDIVELLSRVMRYPNSVVKSVSNIMTCKRELIVCSDMCIKYLFSKYPPEDVVRTIQYKQIKINNGDNKETMILAEDIAVAIMKTKEECYNFKGLKINGHDLKQLGIADLEIKGYLSKLLYLVITKQVENEKADLIQVVKNSML